MRTITLIGSGNVATHLAIALYKNGFVIQNIFSRKYHRAKSLAEKVNAEPTTSYKNIKGDSDIYIIAVRDDAIESVVLELKNNLPSSSFVVHTSGVKSSKVIAEHFSRFGICYPLQSFSKEKEIDFANAPFCLFANQKKDLKFLCTMIKKIGAPTYEVNDRERAKLHVAAVFANNFTNLMYTIAYDIAERENIDFNILKPLILETAQKVQQHRPEEMQTGPAIRKDSATIQKHATILQKYPRYKEIYNILTQELLKNR